MTFMYGSTVNGVQYPNTSHGLHYLPRQRSRVTSRVSGRGHRIGAVCVSVCVSVRTLTTEPFDLWPWFLVWELTLTLARLGLYVKVVGQRSRSLGKISSRSSLALWWDVWSESSDIMTEYDVIVWRHDVIWRHRVTSWRHRVTSWCHRVTS